ncbi:hypothetical protein Emag_001499 [Eimeria magna]
MEKDRARRLLHHPAGTSGSCCSSSSSPPSEESSSSSSSSSSKTSSSSSGYSTSSSDGSCCTPVPSSSEGGASHATPGKGGGGNGKATSPPLSSYWLSPFSSVQIWVLRATMLLSFLYGGLVGWPMASTAALLPQLLLRLFTFGGCGVLLLYDVLFGLRWTYTRLLQQQQNQWVQQQLELLLQENREPAMEALMRERLRLRALVAAFRRCLSLSPTTSPLAAACAEVHAAEADAAAHLALEGDLQLAAALYGVSPSAVEAALQAAKLQQASLGHKGQRRGVTAAAAAAAAAATGSAWAAAKGVLRVACCVPLLMVFVDMPAGAAAAAAAAAGWDKHLHPWLLPLLHAVAQGCLAAAALNLHVGEYTELEVKFSAACVTSTKRSPSSSTKGSSSTGSGVCKKGSGCVLDVPPRRWSAGPRLFVAFAVPLFVSIFAAAGSTAASKGAGWNLDDLLHLPLGLLQLALELLPLEVSSLLPLQQQRSAAADRLLLLLQQQRALGWLQWPTVEAYDMLLPTSLLTAVAAALFRCSSPPPLWKEHAQLEHAAAAAAARKLLGERELLLQKQSFCSRICSRCSWVGRRFGQWMSGIPIHVGRLMRIGCVSVLGLLWVLLLMTAVSDLPLLRTDEGELQTPLQALEQQLQGEEMQQMWAELLQLKREFTRRSEQGGYEEAFDWLLQLLQESWAHQLEAQRNESDARIEALALFDLPESATASEIRHRYRQLARQHHPDLAGAASSAHGHEGASFACGEAGDPFASDRCKESHQVMQKINLAYEVLLGQAGGKAAGLR